MICGVGVSLKRRLGGQRPRQFTDSSPRASRQSNFKTEYSVVGALLRSQHSYLMLTMPSKQRLGRLESSTGDREGEATCSVVGSIVASWPYWLRYQSLHIFRPPKCNCLISGPSRLPRPYWTSIWML